MEEGRSKSDGRKEGEERIGNWWRGRRNRKVEGWGEKTGMNRSRRVVERRIDEQRGVRRNRWKSLILRVYLYHYHLYRLIRRKIHLRVPSIVFSWRDMLGIGWNDKGIEWDAEISQVIEILRNAAYTRLSASAQETGRQDSGAQGQQRPVHFKHSPRCCDLPLNKASPPALRTSLTPEQTGQGC